MNAIATRPHPLNSQTGHPLKAKPCTCSEPFGDEREGTCARCGRQVDGKPIPARATGRALGDYSVPAFKRRRYRPAA